MMIGTRGKTGSGRRWLLCFGGIVLAGILCYMMICFRADCVGYFTNAKGLPYYYTDDYARAIKAQYMLDHKDEIDAVILGGSKSGVISTDLMTEYSGLRYYNMYMNLGNFKDYLEYTRFLTEQVGVREISLFLSSYETIAYDRSYRGNTYRVPALLSGNIFRRVTEFLSWMLVDPSTLRQGFLRAEDSPAYADALVDGMRSHFAKIASYQKDPDAYVANILKSYDKDLSRLFRGVQIDQTTARQNLEALRQIKEICAQQDVTLHVMITPSMMTERYRYEGDAFYQYLAEIVQICGEVWDFSDYNDINMNVYNYTDRLHFDAEVADLMIQTIYGQGSYPGFGQVLTRENLGDYLIHRKADYERLKQEYERSGTVALLDRSDPSYLPWRTAWVSSRAAVSTMQTYWDGAVETQGILSERETETEEE